MSDTEAVVLSKRPRREHRSATGYRDEQAREA
jgi:hypothetical protein